MAIVKPHPLIGTSTVIVEAWEPFAGHTVLTSQRDAIGDCTGWIGLITARPLPIDIERMTPGSPERIDAAVAFHAECVVDALAAITDAYPGILDRTDARVDRGRVELLEGGGTSPLCEPYTVAVAR